MLVFRFAFMVVFKSLGERGAVFGRDDSEDVYIPIEIFGESVDVAASYGIVTVYKKKIEVENEDLGFF